MINPKPRILILGATGMLGSTLFRYLAQCSDVFVTGSARDDSLVLRLPQALRNQVISGVDVENTDALMKLFLTVRPEAVINCIGLVKQQPKAQEPLLAI